MHRAQFSDNSITADDVNLKKNSSTVFKEQQL